MIPRAVCEQAFRVAVGACDPAPRVQAAVARLVPKDTAVIGVAIGKAALVMARGAGPVVKGIAVAPQLDGKPLPLGWTARDAAHPVPDPRSFDAGDAVLELVQRAGADDIVLVLISGGASALVEVPAAGVTHANYTNRVAEKMASGAPIAELNALRRSLSQIKGGRLAEASRARVVTLAVSDVIDDDLHVIGSGPTVAAPSPVVQRRRAQDRIGTQERIARGDVAVVIAPMRSFAEAIRDALGARGIVLPFHEDAIAGRVTTLEPGIHWGEPTLTIPDDHGEGGRAQQLALEMARHLRGTDQSAFVAGSDGIDGPPPKQRPAPAGAYVDGTTWDAIAAAGIDPAEALRRRDAGNALAAVGALVITGPTGINHADVAVVG